MTVRTNPRTGGSFGWATGDNNWGARVNEDLRRLAYQSQHWTVWATADSNPARVDLDGDAYIVGSNPTGDWSIYTKNTIILYGYLFPDYDSLGWTSIVPHSGWTAWRNSDKSLLVYDGAEWRTAFTFGVTS